MFSLSSGPTPATRLAERAMAGDRRALARLLTWIDDDVLPGLSIFVVKGTGVDDLEISPAFTVAGVGVRITKPAGPLLELGSIALDGIGLSIYAAVSPEGVGGGAQIELVGLAVAPGFIVTDMTDVLPDQIKEAILPRIPLGKFGEGEDIAAAVAFLAAPEAKYITGQVLTVDGGMVM